MSSNSVFVNRSIKIVLSYYFNLAQLERNITSKTDDKLSLLLREADNIMHERNAVGETLQKSQQALDDLENINLEFELSKM